MADVLAEYRAYFEQQQAELAFLEKMWRNHRMMTDKPAPRLWQRITALRDFLAEMAPDIAMLEGRTIPAGIERWGVNPADEDQF